MGSASSYLPGQLILWTALTNVSWLHYTVSGFPSVTPNCTLETTQNKSYVSLPHENLSERWPSASRMPFSFLPHGKHPQLPQLFHIWCGFQNFLYNLFQHIHTPFKMWSQKWEKCPTWSLATADTVPRHLWWSVSVLSQWCHSHWLFRKFSYTDPLSVLSYCPMNCCPTWAVKVGFLNPRKAQKILGLRYNISFLDISFLCYPPESWNSIFNHWIRLSSSPSTWEAVKEEPMRLIGPWEDDLDFSGGHS